MPHEGQLPKQQDMLKRRERLASNYHVSVVMNNVDYHLECVCAETDLYLSQ